jgi:hypothetical protein
MPRRAWLGWAQTLLLDAVVPAVTYILLTGFGVQPVLALLAAGVWPLLQIALSTIVHRHLDGLGIAALGFLVLSAVATVLTADPRLVLERDAAWTAVTGVLFLGSLPMPRPLGFYFGRQFATGGVPERVEWWNRLWQYAAFRRSQRVITAVWGVALLADAVLRVWLVSVLPLSAGAVVSPLILVAALGTAMGITLAIARQTRRSAGAAATAGMPAE